MNNSIYEYLNSQVFLGRSFSINFEKRNMKVDKKYLIKDGVWNTEFTLLPKELENVDVLKTIEDMYFKYKHSLPSERSDSKRRRYFKALSIEEIPDALLWNFDYREREQAKLEGFILCSILSGNLKWTENMGKWFYQSKNDPDLVILKSWIENN